KGCKKYPKTYNTRYSLVVTDPTTNPALIGLSMGERTGSRVFQWVWSYVTTFSRKVYYKANLEYRNTANLAGLSFCTLPESARPATSVLIQVVCRPRGRHGRNPFLTSCLRLWEIVHKDFQNARGWQRFLASSHSVHSLDQLEYLI
ncbi:hypothetical protein LZ30DRAFT_607989, partial [Colletotrichum cereale]